MNDIRPRDIPSAFAYGFAPDVFGCALMAYALASSPRPFDATVIVLSGLFILSLKDALMKAAEIQRRTADIEGWFNTLTIRFGLSQLSQGGREIDWQAPTRSAVADIKQAREDQKLLETFVDSLWLHSFLALLGFIWRPTSRLLITFAMLWLSTALRL